MAKIHIGGPETRAGFSLFKANILRELSSGLSPQTSRAIRSEALNWQDRAETFGADRSSAEYYARVLSSRREIALKAIETIRKREATGKKPPPAKWD